METGASVTASTVQRRCTVDLENIDCDRDTSGQSITVIMFTGLDFGRRRKTTCEVVTSPVMTSPGPDETRRGKAVPDAWIRELRMSRAATAGDTESTANQTAWHTHQRLAFMTHKHIHTT